MNKLDNKFNTKGKYKFYGVTPNGETEEFTVPLEFQDIFVEKLEKQKRLNNEVRNLIYKVKKSKYGNNNMLIRLYFKKSELMNLRYELSLILDILGDKNIRRSLLNEIKNNNLLDLI